MTPQEAHSIITQVINAAVKAGLFNDTKNVLATHAALEVLKPKEKQNEG